MKPTVLTVYFLSAAMAAGWGAGYAADRPDLGKREYENSCAVCHGLKGKGDGPLAGIIATRVSDLTTLAARNNGVFPLSRVYDSIEGTADVKAHGPRDMPVWGARYRVQAAEHYVDVDYDARAVVRTRILAIAEYLYRLQAK